MTTSATTAGDEVDPIVAEHAEIRAAVRASAALSGRAVILNALAAVIATYGLFANSAPVVIGAMVVAVLLGPILGVGISVAEGAPWHLARSLRALAVGTVTVFVTALLVGRMHTDFPITAEILQRTSPNLSDLVIEQRSVQLMLVAVTACSAAV